MGSQYYIDKAVHLLQGPGGLVALAIFVFGCIAFLRMDANRR